MLQLPGKGVTTPVIPVHGICVKVEIWLNNAKFGAVSCEKTRAPRVLEMTCVLCQGELRMGRGVVLKIPLNFSPMLGDLQLFSLAVAPEILPTIKRAALPQ